ncbi:MAG: class I SAM-dependent methyltransferase [Myxococcota bacterium]
MSTDPSVPIPTVVGLAGTAHRALLEQLAIPVVAEPVAGRFLRIEVEGQLELRPPDELDRRGIRAELPPERAAGSARAHPLVRAFGKARTTIFDLTAGLGADAYRLADAGHRVRACEREPVLYALLVSGWAQARRTGQVPSAVADRLEFVHGEARALLDSIALADAEAGAAYLDPMYPPPKRASALPRRELQVLRRLLGRDDDAAELLAAARARFARVVVKRPTHAPPLAEDVSYEVESKLLRLDVYLDPKRMGARAEAMSS